MALDRTNMVSLLDVGLLMGSTTSNIVELGDGFTEVSEDWGPDIESTQYVNMKSKASTLKGYEFTTTLERQYISDAVQEVVDDLFKKFPTGAQCETFYYRYYKTDLTTNTGECIKVPVIVAPSSTGGAGGDILVSSIQINGNGDAVLGNVTIDPTTGVHTWAAIA